MNSPVAIIGGGLGGLAAACTLAARGHRVSLFEKNEWVGGKAAVLERNGFRFDMGPTILTMPGVLRKIFTEAGENLEDRLSLVRLDPQWRSFFEDGSTLDLFEGVEEMAALLEQFAPGKQVGDQYRSFIALARDLDRISQDYYFWRPVGGLRDMFNARHLARPATLKDVLRMRMGSTVAGTLRSFISDPQVSQMLDHFTQYVGSAPDASPAVLCGIAHMQVNEGVWYPMGGTRAVATELERLARRLGVEIHTEMGIEKIFLRKGAVAGLLTSRGDRIECATVISNSDSVRTHRELLKGEPEAKAFENSRKFEPACSGVVLYLGLKKRYGHLAHHNFIFSRDPHEEFECIYRKGEPAPDPTCYVCAPAGTDPTVAPHGAEALYVLVHTPFLRPHHDWQRMLPDYRAIILDKLKKTGGMVDIEDRIVCEAVLTPHDIHSRYRVLNGAIYGLASHGRFFGAFKPGNRTKVPGLYLAGGSAHPGPGMPMALMSGWIAADAADADLRGRAAPLERVAVAEM